jgi:hypothetical protein
VDLQNARGDDSCETELACKLAMERIARNEVDAEALDWLRRYRSGESYAAIAADADFDPATVRKRVSRVLRLIVKLSGIVGALLMMLMAGTHDDPRLHEITSDMPSPAQRAAHLRKVGIAECDARRWRTCVEALDAARDIDPAGESNPRVQAARRAFENRVPPPQK